MKSYVNTKKAFLLTAWAILALTGCRKVEEGINAITWELNFDLVATTWDIQFLDAATGEMIGANGDERVEVKVTGPDAQWVLDLAGKRQPVFYSTRGFLAFALHPDRKSPDYVDPVKFRMHVTYPGYVPVAIPVITPAEGIHPMKVYLTSVIQPPTGVALVSVNDTSSVIEGKIRDTLILYTPGNDAKVRIEGHTDLLTASGAMLGGSLDVVFGYWKGADANAIQSMPGGTLSLDELAEAGQVYPAGTFYLSLTDEFGKPASTLGHPATIQILLPKSVYDPVHNSFLTAETEIPLWQSDPSSGSWIRKGTVSLEPFQDRCLATLYVMEPGLWMLGWIEQDLCNSNIRLNFNTLPEYNKLPYAFTARIYQILGDEFRLIRTTEIGGPVTDPSHLSLLPADGEFLVRFDPYIAGDKQYYRVPDPILLTGFCAPGYSVDLDLLPKPNGSFKEIEVVFIDVEHNRTRYNPKVFPGYYRKSGESAWQSAFVYNGAAFLIYPEEGALYEMGINFKGEFHQKEVRVGSEETIRVEIEID